MTKSSTGPFMSSTMRLKPDIRYIVFIVLLISFVYAILVGEIPTKGDRTVTTITKLGVDARVYFESNHHLPYRMEEFNREPEFQKDGWGRPILYSVLGSNVFSLRSLGPRGVVDDSNFVYFFDVSCPYNIAGTRINTLDTPIKRVGANY